jgi:serine/threonine protein kinase
LEYLHNQNPPIIHRDIKPRNIITPPQGEAVLVDFGIAKVGEHTMRGAKAFTPGFSPPEQYTAKPTGPYSDIYALGATLYAMLTGDIPPSATDRWADTPLTPPRKLNRELSRTAEKALLKAMELDSNDRYQSVGEFYRAFTGDPVGKSGEEKPDKRPEKSKKPWMAVGGAVVAIALLITGVLLFSGDGGSPGIAPTTAPAIEEMVVEMDNQTIEAEAGDFEEVTCDASHRIEVKLLDANRARIQPEAYSFNWRFAPSDPDNQDKLGSGNYALIYQPSCDLNSQTVIIEVLEEGKTLHTRSIRFDITQ